LKDNGFWTLKDRGLTFQRRKDGMTLVARGNNADVAYLEHVQRVFAAAGITLTIPNSG